MSLVPEKNNKIFLYRVAVFYGWILIALTTLAMYFLLNSSGEASFQESKSSIFKIMALLTPQLTIMSIFFFSRKDEIITADKNLGVCLTLTFVYLISFAFSLYWGIYFRHFGLDKDIDQNTEAFVTYMGYLSMIGVGPVTYLFAKAGFQVIQVRRRNTTAKPPKENSEKNTESSTNDLPH